LNQGANSRQKDTFTDLWNLILSKSKSSNTEEKKEAIELIFNNYSDLPQDEAINLLITLIDPRECEEIRIYVAELITKKEFKIPTPFYLRIISKLSVDPSENVKSIIKNIQIGNLYYDLLKDINNFNEKLMKSLSLGQNMVKMAEFGKQLADLMQRVSNAFSFPAEVIRQVTSPFSLLNQYFEALNNLGGAIEKYRSLVDQKFVIPREYSESIISNLQTFARETAKEQLEKEKLEDIDQLISELVSHAESLPIFKDKKSILLEGISVFSNQKNYRAAFLTLLNVVEGVIRNLFTMQGLGGTDQSLIPMVEKLKDERWISDTTENLIKALGRNTAYHSLLGDYDQFPEITSQLVLFCLLKIARDFIYFKVLRMCLNKIIKSFHRYSGYTMEELLAKTSKKEVIHVVPEHHGKKIIIKITLFKRDYFEFLSTGPGWDTIELISQQFS
jgi:hypothetical protein